MHTDIDTEPRVIAVWAKVVDFEPETVQILTGDGYADWYETNHLADAFPWPTRFYGLAEDGGLIHLDHTVQVSPYDEDDYATVTHIWTQLGTASTPYTTGCARRDGRA